MVLANSPSRILQGMYSGFLRFPSHKEIWCSESGSGDFRIKSGDPVVTCEKKNSDCGTCVQGIILPIFHENVSFPVTSFSFCVGFIHLHSVEHFYGAELLGEIHCVNMRQHASTCVNMRQHATGGINCLQANSGGKVYVTYKSRTTHTSINKTR